MKRLLNGIAVLLIILSGSLCIAHTSQLAIKEDFKPSSINQPGKKFPQVNSEGRGRASISAPDAKKVLLDIGGVKYDLTKDESGVWTGNSNLQNVRISLNKHI